MASSNERSASAKSPHHSPTYPVLMTMLFSARGSWAARAAASACSLARWKPGPYRLQHHPGPVQAGQRGQVPAALGELDPFGDERLRLLDPVAEDEHSRQPAQHPGLSEVVDAVHQCAGLEHEGERSRGVPGEPALVLEHVDGRCLRGRVGARRRHRPRLVRERHPQAAQLGDVAGPRRLQEQLQPSGVAVRAGRHQAQRLVVAVVGLVRGAGPAGAPGRAQGEVHRCLVVARGVEVVGDGRGERVDVLRRAEHDRLGQPRCARAAVGPDQLVGERLPRQRVPEDVRRTPPSRTSTSSCRSALARTMSSTVSAVAPAACASTAGSSRSRREGRELEHVEAARGSATGPGQQRLPHRGRHLDVGQVAALPVVAGVEDVATLDEDLRELLDEERVAAACVRARGR